MLSLSTGISSLQFASYMATCESKRDRDFTKDFANTAANNFDRSLSRHLSADDEESELVKQVTYKVLKQIKEAREEDSEY